MRSILLVPQPYRADPFIDETSILSRAYVVCMINPARERIVVDRAAAPFEPGEQACAYITGQFKLHRSASLLLRDDPTRADFWASDQITNLDLDEIASSQLAVDRQVPNSARSRKRPSRSIKKRIAHICFCVSGRFVPTVFPAFHAADHELLNQIESNPSYVSSALIADGETESAKVEASADCRRAASNSNPQKSGP
jgi:hypothetical protein